MTKFTFLLCFIFLSACATGNKDAGPSWVKAPTRIVDNGYIVYVGTGESRDVERAQFKAEGMALEDLANECSFIPKGTRLEDRFVEKGLNENTAYVKVAVEFQECIQAQKSLEPSDIKRLANASFTEQLRRYQDLEESGELPDKSEYAELTIPTEIPPAPTQGATSSSVHFAVLRQYVAYQKEVVILSPATMYTPGSPASANFVNTLRPTIGTIEQSGAQNPSFVKNPQPWSKIYDRPRLPRPAGIATIRKSNFKSAMPMVHANQKQHEAQSKGHSKKGGGRRRTGTVHSNTRSGGESSHEGGREEKPRD